MLLPQSRVCSCKRYDKEIELDVEIWPTSIVCSVGYRLMLTFEYDTPGRMLHYDPLDRPEAEFGGLNTIHTGIGMASYLLLLTFPVAHAVAKRRSAG